MKRFAAKLLFDWCPDPVTGSRSRRLFEERIIVFRSRSARSALATAKRRGGEGELRADSGHKLRFVGLVQLMELGVECGSDEVWWEFRRRRMTIGEARARLLSSAKELYVFTDEALASAAEPSSSRGSRPARGRKRGLSRQPGVR